nr:immunoglobulin heavy chain junction region [Macaca mulatta]MOV90303.1 immunoglobulin heavy chain junction region [Macaca mulatta]MOV90439.1 immunoglobulin heavy chain junction region [Macaca mulatta]MOV91780.1 immunoglobulin heavy chain junction region [Macaca mulatta]
CNSLMLGYW